MSGRLGASSIAIDLPGCSSTQSFAWRVSLVDYVNTVIASAKAIDGPVVLVAHSSSGIAASQAAALIPQGICCLIYLAAYVPINGESLASLSAKDQNNNLKSAIKPDFLHGTLMQASTAIKASSYHEISDELAEELVAKHRHEPIRPSMGKVRLNHDFDAVPKHYVQTTEDRALAPQFQKWMADHGNIEALHPFAAGHMPMIVSPVELAALLVKIAKSNSADKK